MLKELVHFQFFGHPVVIFGYGAMLVVAFLATVFVGKILARRNGIDPEHVTNAVMIGLITGIAGARICDVLENLHEYFRPERGFWENLLSAINIHEGGLTFYGGFILATPCCIAYAWAKKIPILRGMDIVAPMLMVALGVGRIGCFLNGCCYGERCELPWAVQFPYYSDAYIQQYKQREISPPPQLMAPIGNFTVALISPDDPEMQNDPSLWQLAARNRALPVHPTELYSVFTCFLLAGLLIAYLSIRTIEGRVFALMLMLEGASRYLLELIRIEPPIITIHIRGQPYGASLSMVLGLWCVVAGLFMWNLIRRPTRSIDAAKHRNTSADTPAST